MNKEIETNLLGPAHIQELCQGLGIKPTKTLGQNFVHDAGTVRKIVRESAAGKGVHVLEVGPGLGSLTLALLESGAAVTAIEIDRALARALPVTIKRFAGEDGVNRLRLLTADALDICCPEDLDEATPARQAITQAQTLNSKQSGEGDGDSTGLAPEFTQAPTAMVANLPYNVAVPVLLNCLENLPSISNVLVMVQAEVADRLAAGPGSKTYGVPSVKLAWYGQARRTLTIGRKVFWPIPNVDSALVEFTREDIDWGIEREYVFAVIDAAFAQRRKTLRAGLKNWLGAQATQILDEAGIESNRRAESLGIKEFVRLAKTAAEAGFEAPLRPGVKATKASAQNVDIPKSKAPKLRVRASAPGKVNLLLHSGKPDRAGKHPLFTVFQAVELREYVTASQAAPGVFQVKTRWHDQVCPELVETTPDLGELDGAEHLSIRAARALAATLPPAQRASLGVSLQVEKQVPIAGGMAGGSADAAAALWAVRELWGLETSDEELLEIAKTLGADVPFCLVGGVAAATGYGDEPTPLACPNHYRWIFALAKEGLSTPAVFTELDRLGLGRGELATEIASDFKAALETETKAETAAGSLGKFLENDLEEPAFGMRPELRQVKEIALQAGAAGVVLSGSGPSVAILPGQNTEAVTKALRESGLIAQLIECDGPAAGARLEELNRNRPGGR